MADFDAKPGEMHAPVKTFNKLKLTPGRIDAHTCPDSQPYALLWDTEASGLALRTTPKGVKAWHFQFRIDRKPGNLTIGSTSTWTLSDARAEARRLKVLVDQGVDPRDEKKEKATERQQRKDKQKKDALTLKELWNDYVAEHAQGWSAGHLRDHHSVMREPGLPVARMLNKKTKAGPLWALANERVVDIPPKIEGWLKKEKQSRPTLARKAYVLLKTCLSWHGIELGAVLDGKDRRNLKRAIPKPKTKDDVLEASQLAAWWQEVGKLPFVSSIFLKCLLLIGCRRNELAELRWDDVDLTWNRMTIKDKVEGSRVIPLTPYVRLLIQDLKAKGERIDAEREEARLKRARNTGSDPDAGKGDLNLVFRGIRGHGGTQDIEKPHAKACQAAGLPHITQHGLRRSFITLAEEAGVPSGAVAQICGHKPSALVERSYKRRSIDRLTEYHQKIEEFLTTEAKASIIPIVSDDIEEAN